MPRLSDLLSAPSLRALSKKKNLLAFSAGVDSSALFFLLLEQNIPFDIAIVDYNLRAQSKDEVAYAKALASTHDKICYHDSITLPASNFEHHARTARYQFFEAIIAAHHYDNLLTAHQLNDRLEWFLMQLGRGAGLVEMLGFDEISTRQGYQLIRPLIHTKKEDLEAYLDYHDKRYFIDESNHHDTYARNKIRATFSDEFLKDFAKGVTQSFTYLAKDKAQLSAKRLYHDKDLTLIKNDANAIRGIDLVIKQMGYLLSSAQRQEIEKSQSCVIANKIVVAFSTEVVFIAPYGHKTMDKKFKEICRTLGIPAKIRPYLLEVGIAPSDLPLDGKVF